MTRHCYMEGLSLADDFTKLAHNLDGNFCLFDCLPGGMIKGLFSGRCCPGLILKNHTQ